MLQAGAFTVRSAAFTVACSSVAWAEARLRWAVEVAFALAFASDGPVPIRHCPLSVRPVRPRVPLPLFRSSWAAATARSETALSSASFLMVMSTSPSLTLCPACTLIFQPYRPDRETTDAEMSKLLMASTVVVSVPSVTMSVTGPLVPAGCVDDQRCDDGNERDGNNNDAGSNTASNQLLRRRSARCLELGICLFIWEISAVSFVRSLCLSACTFVIRGIVSVAPSGVRSVCLRPG